MIPRCPLCGAELVELGPDGTLCTGGHWFVRVPETGELVPQQPADDSPSGSHQPERERRSQERQATKLVQMGREAELWHTPDGETWATIDAGDHREHWPLNARPYREWLRRQYWERYGAVPGAQALQDALDTLAGYALYDGPTHEVHTRLAGLDGRIYLDLADAEWRAVEISADGWRVVTDPPVRFRRPRGMQPLPAPQRGGSIDRLWRYANVAEADRVLLAAWATMTLSPRGPYPVLVLSGEQGSGKSTTARVLRRLIDPNEADLRAEPREVRDLVIAARNGWIVAIDNVSRLPQWLSDALCRLSTGAGFATRELYTDTDEVIVSAQRPAIITSIADVVTAPDLLDRSILVTCPVIEDDARETESEFWRRFEADWPLILGALCDLVSRALRELPRIKLDRYPRMADFARWAVAALGKESGVLERYLDNRASATTTAVEASPVAEAILVFMAGRESWLGTATELLDELNAAADEETRRRRERLKAWPKTGRGLAGELRQLAPALRSQALAVQWLGHVGHDRRRLIQLEWAGHRPFAPFAPFAADDFPRPDGKIDANDRRTIANDANDSRMVGERNRSPQIPHAGADANDANGANDGLLLRSDDVTQRLLAALRERGRAMVCMLALELGLAEREALAAAERLLAAGLVRRVDIDPQEPFSPLSSIAVNWGRVTPSEGYAAGGAGETASPADGPDALEDLARRLLDHGDRIGWPLYAHRLCAAARIPLDVGLACLQCLVERGELIVQHGDPTVMAHSVLARPAERTALAQGRIRW